MEYETFANQCFAQMLEETPLRPGVTAEDARTYFFLVQEAFSSRRSGTARPGEPERAPESKNGKSMR